ADLLVWRGEERATRSRFTFKEAVERARDASHLSRLENEYRFHAVLEHDHLLRPVREELDRGTLVFEDCQGNMRQYLEKYGRLEVDRVDNVRLWALHALDYLHRQGLGHGSINLQTMLVDPRGKIKLGDFLGYKFKGETPLPEPTLKYQAPEIIHAGLGACGPSSDLYCLGFAALEMLTGNEFERLFGLFDAPLQQRHNWLGWHADLTKELTGWKESLPHVPKAMLEILEKLLPKQAGDRGYKSARELIDGLQDFRLDSQRVLDALDAAPAQPQRTVRLSLSPSPTAVSAPPPSRVAPKPPAVSAPPPPTPPAPSPPPPP